MNYFLTAQIPSDPETGPFKSNDDITVLDGFTWDFRNVELQFASGKKLKVDGTFEADGVTFTASGSSWDGIYFYSGSTGDITDSAIEEVSSGAAVYAYNVSSVIIEETEIENTKSNSYSMAVWAFGNNGAVELYGNTITADGGPTLLFQDGVEGFLFSNIILMDGSTDGTVYVEDTEVDFAKENGNDGSNVVKGGPGLYAYGDGILNAGFSSGDMDDNDMCSNIGLTAKNGGVLYAHYNNWWAGIIPTPVEINGGEVYAANSRGWSNTACNGVSAMARVAHAAPGISTLAAVAFADAPATEPSNAEEDLFAAKTLVAQQRYEEAVRLFQQILTNYPKDPAAHAALLELRLVHKRAGDAGARSVLASVASAPGPHRASALGALAVLDARAGKDTDAFARVDALAALHPDSYQAFNAQLTAFHVHLSRKHYEAALAILDGMPARNAEDQRALQLAYRAYTIESGQAVSRTFAQEAAGHQPTAKAMTEAGERAGSEVAVMAYPNPFNPSTTLRYELPVEAHVRLAVYDLLGRAVATLVDGPQQAGSYTVAFEASHLPSGTYVYRLEAEAAVYTGVLLLLK